MSLYIRVQLSFWQHRKTLRLRGLIGEAAFLVPLRLWSYAAQNQPDGDFSDYSAEELAMLVAYEGDAQAMLQALQRVGFLDDLKVHGWAEHNGYHNFFSERAKSAARARWKGKDKKGKERKRKDSSIASSIASSTACSINGSIEPMEKETEKPALCPKPEDIYNAYPRKVAKPVALTAITKAIKGGFGAPFLLERTLAYAKARVSQNPGLTPHPATWFNRHQFNDDPETWKDREPFYRPEQQEEKLKWIN